MMKKNLLINLLLLFFCSAHSQTPNWRWAKGFGGINYEAVYSMAIDASGNIYSSGYFEGTVDFDPGAGIFNMTSAGSADVFILKLDSAGNFIWAKSMGGGSNERGYFIALDNTGSGAVYVSGDFYGTADFDPGAGVFNMTSAGSGDIFISRLDTSGNFVWAKAMAGTSYQIGYSMCYDPSGGGFVYITGWFNGTVDFDPGSGVFNLTTPIIDDDMFITKLDASGNFIWAKQITGSTGSDHGNSIVIDTAGGGDVYSTGVFIGTPDFDPGPGVFNLTSQALTSDAFILKLDSAGNFVWAKALLGTGNDRGLSLVLDQAGSGAVFTTGTFEGTGDFDPGAGVFNLTAAGSRDIYISKLDSSGNFIWAKAMGGTGSDIGNSIAVDSLGNVYTTGEFAGTGDFDPGAGVYNLTSAGSADAFLSALDSSGNFVWAKVVGGTSSDVGAAVALNPVGNGNLHLGGNFLSPTITLGSTTLIISSARDFFIAKLDAASFPTGINEAGRVDHGILFFPNPARSEFRIQSSEFRIQNVEIVNVFGQQVYNSAFDILHSALTIDVSSLASGIYTVNVITDGNISVQKLIINK